MLAKAIKGRCLSSLNYSKDYYGVLGLNGKSEVSEVKKAYLNLAKKFHPDTPTGNSEKFKEVSEAYELLSDPRLKKEYDLAKFGVSGTTARPEQWNNNPWENWTKQRNWAHQERTHGSHHFTGKTHGYQYHDPFVQPRNRYTYSQYKRDRHNFQAKKPKTRNATSQESSKAENPSSFSWGLFGIVILGVCIRSLMVEPLRPPEEYAPNRNK